MQNGLAVTPRADRLGRIGLALGYALLCLGMRAIAARHNLVAETGLPLLAYNLGSIFFLTLCGASFYSLGALLVPAGRVRNPLDVFLVRSLAGWSLASLLGYGLALAGVLTSWATTAALALPLCWLPRGALPPYALSRRAKGELALFAAVALYLLCVSGMLFLYLENDFSHYYYLFDSVLRRGDLLYRVPFFSYFYMKGAGASLLMMGATTRFSVQLATLYALLVMALIAYRLCAMATRNPAAPLAGALLILASKAMKIESYKGHTQISLFLLAVPYLLAQLPLAPAAARGGLRLVLAVLLCAAMVLSPPAAVFLVVPLLYWLYMTRKTGGYGGFAQAFAVCCVPAVTFSAMLVSNYLLTGMPEITPLTSFSHYFNHELTRRWISDVALRICLVENLGYDGFTFPAHKLIAPLGQYTALGLAFWWGRGRLKRSAPVRLKRIEAVLGPVFALGFVCPLLYVTSLQGSLKRFIVFYAVLQGVYVVLAAAFALAVLWPMLRARFPRLWPARKALTALCGAAACYALVFGWTPKLHHQAAYARYFFGAQSMAPLFGHWYQPEVAEVDRLVPDGEPVLPLYFSPYATYYKPQKYLRQVLNPYTQGLIEKLGPDAEAARAVYLRQGLRRFVVNLSPNTDDPMLCMVQEAYGALFAPENVARYFRARRVAQDIWLLTLDGTDADGSRPDAAFLAAYARRRNFDIATPRNIFYRPLVKTSELMPELALPRETAGN